MTAVQKFLLDHHPEYGDLSEQERTSLADFCLLWPVFQGAMLGPQYTNATVRQIPETLDDLGVLQPDTLAAEIAHIRHLYYRDGAFTSAFDGLNVNRTSFENKKLIREFLTHEHGLAYPVVDALKAVLLIILRLRNHVFSGTKAFDAYREHRVSFERVGTVLKFILVHHPWRY